MFSFGSHSLQPAPALVTFRPLKPLWGDGTELFSEESVLTLSVDVPNIVLSDMPITELEKRLHSYYWGVRTATRYFPDGKYLIGRDGSMRKLNDDEAVRLSGYLQVKVSIDLNDFPFEDTIARQLETNKPSTQIEKAKNCVLLDVHAHGILCKSGEPEINCMVRFASRDGKVIVENF